MKRTIWILCISQFVMGAALLTDEHVIRAQADQLRRADSSLVAGSNAMTQARQALRVQGDVLDECIKSVFPRLKEPPRERREGVRM